MQNFDLLMERKADDKHYLIGRDVRFINKQLIEMHFQSQDEAIAFDDVKAFQSKPAQIFSSLKETLKKNEWLLSMGTIVLFGDSLNNAEIPLLERDMFAKVDPLRLTSPAGRLDMALSKGCMAELFEEMIFADEQQYFQIDEGICDFAQMQKTRIKKLALPRKKYTVVSSKPIDIPHTYEVRMFLDDRELDSVKKIFFIVDHVNKTLEFRKILLVPKPENLEYIIDGDGFGRNIFLFPLQALSQAIKDLKLANITQTLLYSGNNLLPLCSAFLGSQQGKKNIHVLSLPVPLLTKTITEFLLAL